MDSSLKSEFTNLINKTKNCPVSRWLETIAKDEREFFEKEVFSAKIQRHMLLEKLQATYGVDFSVSSLRNHLVKACSCYKNKESK